MEELMRTSTRPTVRGKEREEEPMEKYKIALDKLDKGHMVAIFLYLVKPKESVEKPGRTLSSMFQVIYRRTVSLNFRLQVTPILRIRLKACRAQWLLRV